MTDGGQIIYLFGEQASAASGYTNYFVPDPSNWQALSTEVTNGKFTKLSLGSDYTDAAHKITIGNEGILALGGHT